MNIYGGLLFNQGHVVDPATARMLAGEPERVAGRDGPDRPQAGVGTREDAARPPRVRRGPGWVELQAALLSAFR